MLIVGVLVVMFLALHAIPRNEFKELSLDGAVGLADGSNLVANNIVADPSVEVLAAPGSLGCKFPTRWENASTSTTPGTGLYNMWFTTYTDNALTLSKAQSYDGFVWEGVTEGVLRPGPGWDSIGVETANVLLDHEGAYRLYYGSSLREHDDFAIGFATSDSEAAIWTKRDEPVLTPEVAWEFGENNGVLEPSVIYDTALKSYLLWYSALGEKDGVLSSRIGHAISNDGITWQRQQKPVLEPGSEGAWDDTLVSHVNVVKDQAGGYHMFYFGVGTWDDNAAMQQGAIGHAYSEDGIVWEKNPHNPIITPEPGTWRGWTVGGPSAAIIDDAVWVWFFGNPTSSTFAGRIGLMRGVCE